MNRKRMTPQQRRKARKRQIMMHCGIFTVSVCTAIGLLVAGFQYINKPKLMDGGEFIPTKQYEAQSTEIDQNKKEETATLKASKDTSNRSYPVPGWQVDSNGWWYEDENNQYYTNGWKYIKDDLYYFDESGYMANGWRTIDGEEYYFDESGQIDEKKEPKLIALTFDDGPSKYTDHLLDVLEENNAKATFFMVGKQLEQFPDTVKRMQGMGMELANHTWDHTYLRKSNPQTMYQKFDMLDAKLKEIVGEETQLYRTPGGGESDEYRAGAKRPLIMWSLDTLDWKTLNVQSNIDAVLNNVQDGDIVLMHDLHQTSVQSCDTIIPELRKRGYKLVTVSEMARIRGITLQNGVDYYSMKPTETEAKVEET